MTKPLVDSGDGAPTAQREPRAYRPGESRYEPFIVAMLVVVPLLAASLRALFVARLHAWRLPFNDHRLMLTLAFEVAISVPLVWALKRRGWRFDDLTEPPETLDAFRGLGVWIVMTAAYIGITLWLRLAALWVPQSVSALHYTELAGSISPLMIFLVVIVNSVWEELLWLGYFVNAFYDRWGLWGACALSIALRVSVHAYQGFSAIAGILPLAIVFTIYYARTRRVWPLILAHMLQNAIALSSFVHR